MMSLVSNGAVRFESFHDDPEDVIHTGRSQLPTTAASREQISLWSVLKQSVGKDLSRLTVPVVFNEPLSFLQRLGEYMEYSDLLRLADEQDDAVKRLEYVTAFAVSTLASNRDRLSKPFNPLLHETYELDRLEDLGFRFVCEQVSHHPPISAFHADGPAFRFYGSIYPKLKFWGRSIDCQPKGILTLELTKRNEVYTWMPINCSIHNLVMGKMYIDLHGTLEVICHSNDLSVKVHFKSSSSWLGKEANHIEGYIVDKSKKKLRALYGDWSEFLASCGAETFEANFAAWDKERKEHKEKKQPVVGTGGGHSPPPARRFSTTDMLSSPEPPEDIGMPLVHCKSTKVSSGKKRCDKTCSKITHLSVLPLLTGSTVLWRVRPRPPISEQFYHFTLFAMALNEMNTNGRAPLPPTDSRLRPDVRLMEDGNIDGAATEKHRLEEKQRDTRTTLKKVKQDPHKAPSWFTQGPHPFVKDQDTWHFNGCYWNRDWSNSEYIF
uniref:Oxysterol-binding protein n=1 Tax=Plectus sambesii TaxID=2011161 RepID=A0A914XCU6_9BILA